MEMPLTLQNRRGRAKKLYQGFWRASSGNIHIFSLDTPPGPC